MPTNTTAANDDAATLAIAGGGISGLSTALYALKHGVPANQIHLFENTARTGGKIQTEYLQGKPVNKGAEFIDTDQVKIREMAQELGVPLVANNADGDIYDLPNGKVIKSDALLAAYRPIAERIIADKEALKRDPSGTGPLAYRLNTLSMDQYLNELVATTPANPNRGFFKALWDTITFHSNHVDPNILAVIKGTFVSEEGNIAGDVSALQFVNEHSATPEGVLASDCAFRVEGGTENIIKAMHKKLADAGVQFHMGAPVTEIAKTADGKMHLSVGGAQPHAFVADKFVSAVPTYALAKIKGLDALGLSPAALQLIDNTQYTNSIKFTVALKDGVTADNGTYFSHKGFQVWSADPKQLTFLANAEDVSSGKINVRDYMQNCMADYAKAMGKPVDSLFPPLSADTVKLTNPGKNQNCYCSPHPGQMLELEKLGNSMDALAANGVGIVGTFFPARTKEGMSVGFMECGLNSAEHTCDILLSKEQVRQSWVARTQAMAQQQATARIAATAR